MSTIDLLKREGFTQVMECQSIEELKYKFENHSVRYSPAPQGYIPKVKVIINAAGTVAVAWGRRPDQLPFVDPVGYYLADNATTGEVREILRFIGCQDWGIGSSPIFQEFELAYPDDLDDHLNKFVPETIGEIWVGGNRTYPIDKYFDVPYIGGVQAAIDAGKIKAI